MQKRNEQAVRVGVHVFGNVKHHNLRNIIVIVVHTYVSIMIYSCSCHTKHMKDGSNRGQTQRDRQIKDRQIDRLTTDRHTDRCRKIVWTSEEHTINS